MDKPAQAISGIVLPKPKSELTDFKKDSSRARNNSSTGNSEDREISLILEEGHFSIPFSYSDNVVFQVEGRQVHVSKVIVCANSPVFNAMLNGNFSEKNKRIIPLADDSYDDFINLMTIIHPPLKEFEFASEYSYYC